MNKLKSINDWGATHLSKIYANPLLIWACVVFTLWGAFVDTTTLGKMTYWSNGVQLIFCPLSVYLSVLSLKKHAEAKERHETLNNDVQQIKDKLRSK